MDLSSCKPVSGHCWWTRNGQSSRRCTPAHAISSEISSGLKTFLRRSTLCVFGREGQLSPWEHGLGGQIILRLRRFLSVSLMSLRARRREARQRAQSRRGRCPSTSFPNRHDEKRTTERQKSQERSRLKSSYWSKYLKRWAESSSPVI